MVSATGRRHPEQTRAKRMTGTRAQRLVKKGRLGGKRMSVQIVEFGRSDWAEICEIYLEGIATGQATFELDAPAWEEWDAAHHPFGRLAARSDVRIEAWAALSPVSRRACYAGVAEVSVYVRAEKRGLGFGSQLLRAVIAESERQGIWTLQGATFPENEASLQLQRSCGFRELGRRVRIAQLHGIWKDTVLTERRSRIAGASSTGNAAFAPE
jgi:L-amino acid N-acyltransferase YncA